MFDPAHRAHLKSNPNPNVTRHFRMTLWEVHPITKLEVWKDNQWVDVDDLP